MNTLTDSKMSELVEDFYAESGDDLVGLWEIAKEVEALLGAGGAVRQQSLRVVEALLAKGLLAGESPYQPSGFVPWPDQGARTVIDRVSMEWLKLGRTPDIPDSPWFGRPQ